MDNKIFKIVLISDTHMHLKDKAHEAVCGCYYPEQIYERQIFTNDKSTLNQFNIEKPELDRNKPDLIIHAGDVGSQNIIDILEGIAPVKVVNGNCDFQDFRTIEGLSEDFLYFDFEGVKIALAHDPRSLNEFIEGGFFRESALPNGEKPNIRVHGHTHESYIEKRDDGTICICPGSATMGRYGTPNSIAVLYICNSKPIAAELIKVK